MNPEKNKGTRLTDVAQVFKVDDEITFNCLLFAINNSIHLHLNPRAQYHTDCVKKELTKIRNKPNVREKIGKFSKERPLITSAGIVVASGVAALPAASLTSNVISSTIAMGANSGTQALISNAFGNVGNSAGMFSGLVQHMVNGISRFTGDALGTIITIAVPPLILGVSAYVFYKAFKLSFKLAINAIGKSSPHKDTSFLPRENDPLFDFLCGMSTIMALKDLELELTLRGFAKIKFNFEQYKEKLTKGHTLNEGEAAIHEIAKKSAERLFAIAKKVETRKKSDKYQNFQETKEIINQIHTNFYFHAPEKSNYYNRYNQFRKCLTVLGALVNKTLVHKSKDPLQKVNFFQVFNSIIRDASITLIQTRETHTNYRERASLRAELAPSKNVAKSSIFYPQGNTQKRQTGIPTTTEKKSLQGPSLFSPTTIKIHNTQSEVRRNDFVKGL